MTQPFVLRGRDNRFLTFKIVNEIGWCQVELIVEDQAYALGAEIVDVLKERLCKNALGGSNGESCGDSIDGFPCRWVLSLSERFGTLYILYLDENLFRFHITRDGAFIGTMDFNAEDVENWRQMLGCTS